MSTSLRLVDVFREVRRVLRDDGTVWLNLGDSYARNPAKGGSGPNGKHDYMPQYGNARRLLSESKGSSDGGVGRADRAPVRVGGDGLKEKDLIGIPWLAAFALRADGWYLRSDVVWSKLNPMPESVTDRPTSAHEHLFLLTKQARYYYDADAIREPHSEVSLARAQRNRTGGKYADSRPAEHGAIKRGNGYGPDSDSSIVCSPGGRNKRNVWEIASSPFPEAHFATYPPLLVEPCILAGSAAGDCVLDPFCGSGTTGVVAAWHGRDFVGVELNPEYAEMARRRIETEGRLGRAAHRPQPRQEEALFDA